MEYKFLTIYQPAAPDRPYNVQLWTKTTDEYVYSGYGRFCRTKEEAEEYKRLTAINMEINYGVEASGDEYVVKKKEQALKTYRVCWASSPDKRVEVEFVRAKSYKSAEKEARKIIGAEAIIDNIIREYYSPIDELISMNID